MSGESESPNLPFEPKSKRPKSSKAQSKSPVSKQESEKKSENQPPFTKEEMAIPKVVSQRMVKRVAFFSGIPMFLGITTLVASYFLLTMAQIKLAPIAVLLVNMGFFGLSVLGITYGVLSASWDEERAGGLVGLREFNTNWGRMVEGWRATRQKKV
ncbi:PAM68 family protein [Calothrix sp. 336/3]|uniref:PAM68 family protein n=1 Tax=Calothrix sp. 336/3 TaxID=1337936 RepID=UPI0004E38820|nr:PAM68 family protein [Calothrix sp. 336/3]AKG19971.1 hypothetical protein IJ00_00365 [Calothrix sp. 336/3]